MRRVSLISLIVCLSAVVACVSVSVKTTGAATVEDLQAEENFKGLWAGQINSLHQALQLFAPAGSNPGVCNKGGTLQGCYDADAKALEALQAMRAAFERAKVPPRFTQASGLLLKAIDRNIEGLNLRNQAIATGDDAAWTAHKTVLADAQKVWEQAYLAFPEDNRPVPAP
jgi:hypothetical protein